MGKEALLKQFDTGRGNLRKVMEAVREEDADIQPAGFTNTIRWNLGHILTVCEQFVFGPRSEHLPAEYAAMFGNGTKPADWTTTPPTLEVLLTQLGEQDERVKALDTSNWGEKFPEPIALGKTYRLESQEELFLLSLFHEGTHLGFINALNKAIQGMK